jgi:ABC-type transport system involved in cytochrome c biogenesis permease subunit
MKELLIIFAILLALLMLISTVGGSITVRQTDKPMQQMHSHVPMPVAPLAPITTTPNQSLAPFFNSIEPFDNSASFAAIPQ